MRARANARTRSKLPFRRERGGTREIAPTNQHHPPNNQHSSSAREHTTCPWLPNRLVTEDSRPIEVPGTLLLQSVSKWHSWMTSFDNSAVVGPHVKSVTKRASYGGATLARNPSGASIPDQFPGICAAAMCVRGGLRGSEFAARGARARGSAAGSSAETETDAAGTPPKCARLRWWVPEARARAALAAPGQRASEARGGPAADPNCIPPCARGPMPIPMLQRDVHPSSIFH